MGYVSMTWYMVKHRDIFAWMAVCWYLSFFGVYWN